MLAVNDFLASRPPEQGKLLKWEKQIFELYAARASYRVISEYLALQGVSASRNEIYRFIHRKKRQHLAAASGRNSNQSEHVKQAKPASESPAPFRNNQNTASTTELPKFDWQKIRDNPPPEW